MNKIAIVISAVFAVALDACDDGANDKIECSTDCNGQLTEASCPYYSEAYTDGTMACDPTTCTLDDSNCETAATPDGTPTIVDEFGFCSSSDVECAAGLVCESFSPLIDGSVCTTSCTGDEDCNPSDGRYCEDSFDPGLAPFCWTQSERYGFCFSDPGCSDSGAACMAIQGLSGECVLACDGSEVGTTSTCGDETCLAGPTVECQQSGSEQADPSCDTTTRIACTAPDSTPCAAEAKFECLTIGDGVGGSFDACARDVGVCGVAGDYIKEAPTIASVLDSLNAVTTSQNQTVVCDLPGSNVFCADHGEAVDAKVECAGSGYLFRSGTTCQTDLDCYLSGGWCIQSECSAVAGFCTIFAENYDVDTDSFVSLTCPTFAPTALVPEWPIGPTFKELVDGEPVPCSTPGDWSADPGAVDSACSGDNQCYQFSDGNYCGRPRAICIE